MFICKSIFRFNYIKKSIFKMAIEVTYNSGGNNFKRSLNDLPHNCPYCHKAITPNPIYAFAYSYEFSVFMSCPDKDCKKCFIAFYDYSSHSGTSYFIGKTSIGNLRKAKFTAEIYDISSSFVNIYQQSFAAEQQNLFEICGVGYRKALEYLIKDYAIGNFPNEKDKIEKKMLAPCINDYVNDARIKSVAKRAVWLGNDETHYVKKWEGKTLEDLKKLIDLTVYWIQSEVLTKSFEEDMPD